MKRARFVAAARDEFLAEVAYYNEAQPGLGARFAAFPLAGSPSVSNTRRVVLKDFPFSLYYRPNGDGIVIFAVSHHARRPGYWLSRTRGP